MTARLADTAAADQCPPSDHHMPLPLPSSPPLLSAVALYYRFCVYLCDAILYDNPIIISEIWGIKWDIDQLVYQCCGADGHPIALHCYSVSSLLAPSHLKLLFISSHVLY